MDIFYEANEKFLKRNLGDIKRGISERSMCANLKEETSIIIRKSDYSMYFVDVEYNRNAERIKTILISNEIIDITSDFLIHARGTQKHENILALEMKKSTATKKEKDDDRARIKALTMSEEQVYKMGGGLPVSTVCGYLIGIYYEIDILSEIITMEYYSNGSKVYSENNSFE